MLTKADVKWMPLAKLKELQRMIQAEMDDRMCSAFKSNAPRRKEPHASNHRVYQRPDRTVFRVYS